MKELRVDVNEGECRQLYRRFDTDDSGEISYREFLAFVEGKRGISRDAPAPSRGGGGGGGGGGRGRDGTSTSQSRIDDHIFGVVRQLQKLVKTASRTDGVSLRESFDHFDIGRIGEIDEAQLADGLRRLNIDSTRQDARDVMLALGGSRDGILTYRQFVRAVDDPMLAGGTTGTVALRSTRGGPKDSVGDDFDEVATRVQRILSRNVDDAKFVFKRIDSDSSGLIDFREFMSAMKELRVDVNEGECRQLYRRFDTDDSGEISYREFLAFVEGKRGISRDAPSPRGRSSSRGRRSRRDY
jgi:Ca2+-binding EF-hand superfamily protein